MNRHDLANIEQLALLREALEAEPAQPEEISEPTQSVSEPAAPDNADANPEPLSGEQRGPMFNRDCVPATA